MIPLLILGLLKQNPGSYGYELLALMKKNHYKYIVNFTKGSFYYNLQQLEEKQLIKQVDVDKNDRTRETYNYIITELGNKEFEKLMYQYGSKTEYVNLSFYTTMLFANEYKTEDFIQLLNMQIMQTRENPAYFNHMLNNSLAHHLVNVEWFEGLLNEIRSKDV